MVRAGDAARVLRFWQLQELITADSVPKCDEQGPRSRVHDLDVGGALPWVDPDLPAPDPGYTWRFRIFGGLFELVDVHRHLIDRYGSDGLEPESRKQRTRSALYTVELDDQGHVVPGTADLSMCAWATSRALDHRQLDLDAFLDEQAAFVDQLNRLADPDAPSYTGAERPTELTARDRAAHRLGEAARSAGGAAAKGVGAAAGDVVATTAGAVGALIGPVVAAFVERVLTPPSRDETASEPSVPAQRRLDVTGLTSLTQDIVAELGIDVVRPRGIRVRAQQVKCDDEPRPFSLNGTFAKDLDHVRRARRGRTSKALEAYLSTPGRRQVAERVDVRAVTADVDAGVAPLRLPLGRWPAGLDRPLVRSQQYAVNQIRSRLADGGLLGVNGPPGTGKTTLLRDVVANVVVERAVQLAMLGRPADGFGQRTHQVLIDGEPVVSIRSVERALTGFEVVLGATTKAAGDNVATEIPAVEAVDLDGQCPLDYFTELASSLLERPAWGLIAARLGGFTRRHAFARTFWTNPGSLREQLQHAEQSPPTACDWHDAVRDFRASVSRVEVMVGERQAAADALARLPGRRDQARQAGERVSTLLDALRALAGTAAESRRRRDVAATRAEHARRELERRPRPSALAWLWLGPTGWKEDRLRYAAALGEVHDREREHEALVEQCGGLEAQALGLDAEHTRAVEQARRTDDALLHEENHLADARARWGAAVPAETGSGELDAPWADPDLVRARTEVFLSAMRLHRAFVLGAAAPVRRCLSVVADHLLGRRVGNDEHLLMAWQAFFLVVPVVSTTFASLPSVFRGLGAEELGWLLVDEAGQSTPQALAGALWRAKRAVVVGDPLQLEPVLPVPRTVTLALGQLAGVSSRWTSATSAQRVADRATPVGTYLPARSDDEPTWVGMPLRVHRRCDRPIFDIFSRMAYGDGVLAFGTSTRNPVQGGNAWIQVPTLHERGKWSEGLRDALVELLRHLWRTDHGLAQVGVLTPFTDIATQIARLPAAPHLGKVGTVHTIQGGEMDTVVLVLGTGTAERGAREWLASTPNLLNVAVSRARRRLYVVGDRKLWASLPYVDELAASLPVVEPESPYPPCRG